MRCIILTCSCTSSVVRDGVIDILLRILIRIAVIVVDVVLGGVLLPVGTLLVLLGLAHFEFVLSALPDYLFYLWDHLETVKWRKEVMWISLALVRLVPGGLHLLVAVVRLELHLYDLINLLKDGCWNNFMAKAALYNTNQLAGLELEILNVLLVDVDFVTEVNILAVNHFIQALVAILKENLVLGMLVASPVQQCHILLVKAHIAVRAILLLVLGVNALVRHWWLFVVLTPKHNELPFFFMIFEPLLCTWHPRVKFPHKINSLLHPLEINLVFLYDFHELGVKLVCVAHCLDKWQF